MFLRVIKTNGEQAELLSYISYNFLKVRCDNFIILVINLPNINPCFHVSWSCIVHLAENISDVNLLDFLLRMCE